MKIIIFATANAGKAKEVKKLFAGSNIEIKTLADLEDAPEIIEDADTFEGNAEIKARVIFDKYKKPVIADDSGLEVEQLGNAPGVYSARYAGENSTYADNNRKLINELSKFEKPHLARFVCAAVYYDGNEFLRFFGELKGGIIDEYRGENGFGFDPIFIPENDTRTLAEYSLREKNRISHRAKAFEKLKIALTEKEII